MDNNRNEFFQLKQLPDLNLLIVLDALLATESVSKASARLRLSSPAVSRALGRLRKVTGDPLLVRAGQRLVPTPRALALRGRVAGLMREAGLVLGRDGDAAPPKDFERTFTVRAEDVLIGHFAGRLAEAARRTAPNVRLRFTHQGEKDVDALRTGRADLDVSVLGAAGPEIKVQPLYRDRFVGAVRVGHPLLARRVTAQRFVGHPHVSASRRGKVHGPVDDALAALSLSRRVTLVVPTVSAALLAAVASDLVATVPERVGGGLVRSLGLVVFRLPVETPRIEVCQSWHPRSDVDPEHRWLRELVRTVIKGRPTSGGRPI